MLRAVSIFKKKYFNLRPVKIRWVGQAMQTCPFCTYGCLPHGQGDENIYMIYFVFLFSHFLFGEKKVGNGNWLISLVHMSHTYKT